MAVDLGSQPRRVAASAFGNIVAAVFLWGVIPFAVAAAAQQLLPGELVTLRMLLAGAILTALAGPRRFWAALRGQPVGFLALALLGFALPNLLFVYALRSAVSIAVLNFVGNVYPVWAIALASLFLHERPTGYHVAGLACAVAGLYMMAGVTPGNGSLVPAGILLMLVASVGWGTASVISKSLMDHEAPAGPVVDGRLVAAGRHLLSGFLLCPLVLFEGSHLRQASAATLGALLVLVALSVASYQLYYRGLAHTSVANASLVETFAPVVSWGVGAAIYGQGLSPAQAAAACLILAGTVLVTLQALRGTVRPHSS